MGKLEIPAGDKQHLPAIQTANKDVAVSWIYAWSREREMSIHENRVLLRAMEIIGDQMKGKQLSNFMYKVTPAPKTYEIKMSVKDAFFRDMKPEDVKTELIRLQGRFFEWEERDHRNRLKRWWRCSFIEHPDVQYGEGTFTFAIYKPFAEVLLNFTEGYRQFELNKALALPSTYAVRFYILVSGGGEPLYMSVEDFKKWAGIDENDYKDKNGKHRIDNLENRIIKPAQKALDESCPWTFTYEKVKKTKHPRSAVIGFRFYPKEQRQHRDTELEKDSLLYQLTRKNALGEDIYNILTYQLKWPKESIDRNRKNIDIAKNVLGKEQTTATIAELVTQWHKLHAENPSKYNDQVRYVIGILKKRVTDVSPSAFDKSSPVQQSLFDSDIPY